MNGDRTTPVARRVALYGRRLLWGATFALALALALASTPAVQAAQAAQAATTATASAPGLLIAYQVAPASRPALRKALLSGTRARLQQLKERGALADYRLLLSRHVDADGWDAMTVVTFADARQAVAWREVERTTPGGLDAAAAALTSTIRTTPVELQRSQRSDPPSPGAVVLAIPYQSLVAAGEYLAYADGYVIPQFQGWMREGVLTRFELHASTYAPGRPWSHVILLDYRDDAALAARGAVVARVRAQLKDDPVWRAISENKSRVRDERPAVLADDITNDRDTP